MDEKLELMIEMLKNRKDTLAKAVTAGVEIEIWNTKLSGDEVTLKDQIEFSY